MSETSSPINYGVLVQVAGDNVQISSYQNGYENFQYMLITEDALGKLHSQIDKYFNDKYEKKKKLENDVLGLDTKNSKD